MTRRDSDPSLCLGRVLFVVAVVTIVLALVAFGPVGCAAGKGFSFGPKPVPSDPSKSIAGPSLVPVLTWLASSLMVLGVGGFVASFWLPIIPRKLAGACIAASVGCIVLARMLYRMGDWFVVGVGVVLIVLAVAFGQALWQRWKLNGLGAKLAGAHPEAAVALKATARGWTKEKHKSKRKQLAGA